MNDTDLFAQSGWPRRSSARIEARAARWAVSFAGLAHPRCVYQLLRTQRVPRPRSEVFAFFSDAANLEALTPPFLAFQIESQLPIVMRPGAIIDYRLKLHGIPVRWRTVIEAFEPEVRFIDTQARGPYRLWHHEHTFRDTPDGGTEMTDNVHYELPLPPFGRIAHPFIRRALRKVFDFRHQVIAERFG